MIIKPASRIGISETTFNMLTTIQEQYPSDTIFFRNASLNVYINFNTGEVIPYDELPDKARVVNLFTNN